MIAIGVGCRRGISAEAVIALVRRAGMGADGLFTLDSKSNEAGLIEAAKILGLPIHFLPSASLRAMDDDIVTRSDHSLQATGIASVAEASALVGAGKNARLILPKISGDGVSCAVAAGDAP